MSGAGSANAELAAVELPTPIRSAIVEHCRQALPNEACGLIAGDAPAAAGGRARRWLPARNALESPYRFELHPDDLIRLVLDIDAADEVIWAIVHSHVASAAVPSATDRRESRYPEAIHVVVSLAAGASIRAWAGERELEVVSPEAAG